MNAIAVIPDFPGTCCNIIPGRVLAARIFLSRSQSILALAWMWYNLLDRLETAHTP